MSVFDSALADMLQIAAVNGSHMLGGVIEQYRAAETDYQRVNALVAAIGVYDGLLRGAERQAAALQAIADGEPATIMAHGYYETPCDRCKELIAMAREGLEAERYGPSPIGDVGRIITAGNEAENYAKDRLPFREELQP